MQYLRRVLPYIKPYWKLAIVSVCLIFVGSAASLLTPWPLQILVDYVVPKAPFPWFLQPFLGPFSGSQTLLLAITVTGAFLVTVLVHGIAVFENYVNTRLDQGMALDFRTDLFEHSQKLSLAYHDERKAGNLIFAINSQGDAVSRLIMTIPPVCQSALSLVAMSWICWKMDWELTLIALVIAPLLYVSTNYYMKHIHTRVVEVKQMEGESLSIVHEAVSMLRVIVAFGRESYEQRRFREQAERAVDARVSLTVRQTLFTLVIATITAGGTSLVMGIGFYHALHHRLTLGHLLVMLTYLTMIYAPLEAISTTIGSLQEVFVSLQIAFDLLDAEPEIQDIKGAISLPETTGHVTFEDVHFSYKDRLETLAGISFDAKPGQVIAIVGATGAGKTTLLSLLPRFYEPQQGSIRVDGHDIRTLTLKSLRHHISIVLQEPVLFSGSIANNIRYGRQEAGMEEIIQAAQSAHAHDFIMRLPKGYETPLGDRGAKLSGGERQRICIARAFLKNAPVLILDEPTSSIDAKTEGVIMDALDDLMVGRTTFIVAHRLSTIRRADLILVMERGHVVEHGPPQELLAMDGHYKKLYDLQMGEASARKRKVVATSIGAHEE